VLAGGWSCASFLSTSKRKASKHPLGGRGVKAQQGHWGVLCFQGGGQGSEKRILKGGILKKRDLQQQKQRRKEGGGGRHSTGGSELVENFSEGNHEKKDLLVMGTFSTEKKKLGGLGKKAWQDIKITLKNDEQEKPQKKNSWENRGIGRGRRQRIIPRRGGKTRIDGEFGSSGGVLRRRNQKRNELDSPGSWVSSRG